MGCRGCGEKSSRYSNMPKMTGDVDGAIAAPGFQPDPNSTPSGRKVAMPSPPSPGENDPMGSFLAAKSLSYEEMRDRIEFQQKLMESQQEQVMLQMTDAMRQIHIDELVAVVNCEKMAVPGMTEGQAIMALHEALQREDFSFITELYPGLKEAVSERYIEIQSQKLPSRGKE